MQEFVQEMKLYVRGVIGYFGRDCFPRHKEVLSFYKGKSKFDAVKVCGDCGSGTMLVIVERNQEYIFVMKLYASAVRSSLNLVIYAS